MTTRQPAQPLSPSEEQTWRALMRLMVQLPRAIDEDMSRRSGLSLTRYVVLMRLSEASERALRMSDLAEASAISPSRMTRIVQAMVIEGLVTRQEAPGDRRASLATLTDAGLQRLQDAWPAHLAGVRALVMNNIDPHDLADFNRVTKHLLHAIENPANTPPPQACPGQAPGDPKQGAA